MDLYLESAASSAILEGVTYVPCVGQGQENLFKRKDSLLVLPKREVQIGELRPCLNISRIELDQFDQPFYSLVRLLQ